MDKNKITQTATKFVQKGQFDKAIKEYQRILDEDPRDIRVLLKIGELYQKRGDNKEAAATLLRVAEAYSADGFFLKAAAVFKQVLKLNPALLDVNLKLAELYQQLGLMNDAMQQYQLVATGYEKAGNTRASLTLLKKLVDLEPDNVAGRVRLAEAYSNDGMTKEAVEELGQVAHQLKQGGRDEEFIKVAERLLFLDASNLTLTRELANIYLERGDTQRALAKLQICFKHNPQDVDTLVLLGQAFLDLGQQPKTLSVYKELAKIYAGQGRREEEQATWQRILSLAPNDADALAATGQGAEVDEPLLEADAEEVLEVDPEPAAPARPAPRAVASSPGSRPPARGEGRAADVQKLLTETDVYLKYGLHQKAADHLARILAVAPDSLAAHQKSKELHLQTGDMAAAGTDLVNCARISLAEGNRAQAKMFLDHLAEIAPRHPELRGLQALVGVVTELPEVEEDAAILVEAELDETTAALPPEDQELMVDEPALVEDISDEALIAPDDTDEAAQAPSDEAMLAEEPQADLVDELAEEPRVEDSGEMDRAALVAAGVEEETRSPSGDALDAFLGPGASTSGARVVASPASRPPASPRSSSPPPRAPVVSEDFERTDVFQIPPELRERLAESPAPKAVPATIPVAAPRTPARAPEAKSATGPATEPGIRAAPITNTARVSALAAPPPSPVARAPSLVSAPVAPASKKAVAPVEDEPSEFAEAEFFLDQGLVDEATEVVSHLRDMVAKRPGLRTKVERLEARLAAALAPPESPGAVADGSFDLASELAEEVAKAGTPPAEEDFQYSVEDVLSDFKKQLEKVLSPEDVEAHYEMGIAYKEMGLVDEAISEFETALRGAEGKAKESDCLSMIGVCRAAKGDFAKALGAFERALRARLLKPEARLNLHFEIGATKEAAGDAAGAVEAYERVAKTDPGYRDVGSALTRVRTKGPRGPGGGGADVAGNGHAGEGLLDESADGSEENTLPGPPPSRSKKIGYV